MMKGLALLLVMANIVFFLWQYHSGALVSSQQPEVSEFTGLQPIFLVSELQQKHENQAIWHAEAITERNPFVSDYLLEQVGKGQGKTESVQLLTNGLVTVPWSELIAKAEYNRVKESGSEVSAVTKASAAKMKTSDRTDEQKQASSDIVPPVGQAGKVSIPIPSDKPEQVRPGTDHSLADALPASDAGQHFSNENANAEPVSVCYEAGPFENKVLFERWRKRSGIAAKFITPVQRDEEEVTGYLVYYPAPDSFEKALANVEMLKKKGITDLWLFRKGESKGEISLGLFRNKERTEKLERQLLAKGLEVKIKPRLKNTQKLYAQIRIEQELEDNLIASRDQWLKQHPEFTIKVSSHCVASPAKSNKSGLNSP